MISRMLAVAICGAAAQAGPFRSMLDVAVTNDTGFGREIFVTGNHADAGNWNPTLGTKLVWNPGNVWTGRVALPAGTAFNYKPVVVPNAYTGICDTANWQYLPPGNGNHQTFQFPAAPPAPYSGKRIYYISGLTNISFIYALAGAAFASQPMSIAGAGRGPGEFLYRTDLPAGAGEGLEFVFSGQSGTNVFYDHAPYPGYGTAPENNYYTTLDVFFVQDGGVFNYRPPATVSAPFIVVSNAVSTFAPSPSRTMKIYLPRGYVQNTWKRYPVVYMHDGENVMPPYTGLGQWLADETVTREAGQGRMREAILVSLNSTADRTREYLPPEDNEGGQGFGDVYARFLVRDVKAKIDAEFRTLPDRANTATAGSSSGGLIATYLGWATNVFGKVGAFSPAYLISPNFNSRIAAEPRPPVRIYMDMGTQGYPENMLVPDYWVVLDHILRDGFVQNEDLLSWLACGAVHNEAAWAARLPACFRFLLNIWDEPNRLAGAEFPPAIKTTALSPEGYAIAFDFLAGWTYAVEGAPAMTGPWSRQTNRLEGSPWGQTSITNPLGALPVNYYRLAADIF